MFFLIANDDLLRQTRGNHQLNAKRRGVLCDNQAFVVLQALCKLGVVCVRPKTCLVFSLFEIQVQMKSIDLPKGSLTKRHSN
jgi:hypothetical protein